MSARDTGQLSVEVPSLEGSGGAAIVELRDAEMRLVEQVSPGEAVDVQTGLYLASVTLPTGERSSRPAEVNPGERTVIEIDASPTIERLASGASNLPSRGQSLDLAGAVHRSLLFQEPRLRIEIESLPSADRFDAPLRLEWTKRDPDCSARLISAKTGRTMKNGVSILRESRAGEGESLLRVHTSRETDPLLLQIAVVGSPVWNTAIPASLAAQNGCEVEMNLGSSSIQVTPAISRDPRVQAIAAYVVSGGTAEASKLAGHAEGLLRGKRADPIGAALGGYAILRLGELRRLHNWTTNLMDWFRWMPDGAVLAAEQAAREEDFRRSRSLYDDALKRGVPLFSDGLSLLISHFRSRQLDGAVTKRAERMLALAPIADFNSLLTSFPGSDMHDPALSLRPRQRLTSRGWTLFRGGSS